MLDNQSNEAAGLRGRSFGTAGDELRIRAAWLYYIEGLTQAEVSKNSASTGS
nr:hypothetical protein [Marinicella sp. W31]MDC2878596.1 hypothetical protein [Marinicella sp. W31]